MAFVSTTTLVTGAAYAVCGGILYCLITISYRLFGHPLRAYPGPILSAISDAYGGYLAYADIYQNPRVTKSYLYLYSRDGNFPTTFSTIEAGAHRDRRKLISQPISQRAMRLFEPSMQEQIDIFLRQIYASAGSVVDMTNRAEWLGIDIVGLISFGYRLNLQTDETYRFIPKDFEDLKAIINCFMQFPFAFAISPVVGWLNAVKRERLRNIIFQMMLARAAREKDAEQDFYSYVKGNLDYGPDYIDKGNFIAEAAFFVTAGGTPPASVICGLFFYLMRYPECYRRLVEEIKLKFRSGNDIKGDALLMGCEYLRACIDETLRMSPPSLTTLWRENDKDDADKSPLIIDGLVIPPGTQVGINMYSLHHNEEYFPDSYTFSPDRFLSPKTPQIREQEASLTKMHEAFVPFLQGTRSCAGKAMAYTEISIVVAKTLWYFDVQSAPGKLGQLGEGVPGRADGRHRVNEYQMYDCNSAAHEGPNLIFRPRPEAHLDLGDTK
ncbi:hypothetical protein CIB48_g6431 [Xylaria polymorpha]|nr:hypothetical protein CIB48_g6431 [Xylaria polymorpha]